MKLILCTMCHDVYKLNVEAKRECKCGNTWGYYLKGGINAEVSDNQDTVILGLHNSSLVDAIVEQRQNGDPDDGMGIRFEAFIIPKSAPTVKRRKQPRK